MGFCFFSKHLLKLEDDMKALLTAVVSFKRCTRMASQTSFQVTLLLKVCWILFAILLSSDIWPSFNEKFNVGSAIFIFKPSF